MIHAPLRGLFFLGRAAFVVAVAAAVPILLKKNRRMADQLGDTLIRAGENLKKSENEAPNTAPKAESPAPKPAAKTAPKARSGPARSRTSKAADKPKTASKPRARKSAPKPKPSESA